MKAAQDSDAAQADFRFHLAIGSASGNHYFRELTEYLGPLLIPRMRVRSRLTASWVGWFEGKAGQASGAFNSGRIIGEKLWRLLAQCFNMETVWPRSLHPVLRARRIA